MIRLLTLNRFLKVRLWLGELPATDYQTVALEERTLTTGRSVVANARRAAVEVFKVTCGPSSYGLLGAEFVPRSSDDLRIHIAVSLDYDRPFEGALASSHDDVRVGLPSQYVKSVLDGSAGADEIRDLGAGDLDFKCAAHGLVGSSQVVFDRLAGTVVMLLATDAESLPEDRLAQRLRF